MIEPGARLAGRYRLEELVSETNGATLWKATDETLARSVGVWTFAEGFPHTTEVVRAARAASRIADARVTQVFDADDSGPTAYVVEEWITGQSMAELLTRGPMDPERAAGLVAEAAEALAAANAAGIFHLCLEPSKVTWSPGGAVKVTGIGVDAALRGITSERPDIADAQGIGDLLYAALTAHWPRGERTGLPAAPATGERPYEPGQLRPGIPDRLNDIICRSAFQEPGRGGPLTTSQAVADALADVPRMVPMPVTSAESAAPPPETGTSRQSGGMRVPEQHSTPPPRRSRPTRGTRRAARKPPRGASKALLGAAAFAVFAAVVSGAWVLGNVMRGNDNPEAGGDEPAQQQPAGVDEQALEDLTPASATGFDPAAGGDGDEHSENAGLAIDGDPSTAWSTEGYKDPLLHLKEGVGLLIDMGETVTVREIDLALTDAGPAEFEIMIGDEKNRDSMTTVHIEGGASGDVPVKVDEPTKGRYVAVWFTDLPSVEGKYRGTIHEVELRGNT
ncbi:protein kinase family protein [Salinactinospora qingdaonensis]|uniref:Protein kinase family protein n=1 Tax=Salinactinospora qingdaonensis TaxID=702744 RepID=A0ABP7F7R9_9ACTN